MQQVDLGHVRSQVAIHVAAPALLRSAARFVRRKPLGALGMLLVLALVLMALAAPLIARYDPQYQDVNARLERPSAAHWFGTDQSGRDIYARTVWGARVSLGVGLVAMAIAVTGGVVIGMISGYFGGITDLAIQRVVDGVQAFPGLILLLLLVTVTKPSVHTTTIALGVLSIASVSRIARSSVLATKVEPYVESARVVGASHARVMFRHILPNIVAPVIVIFTIGVGGAILAEASLSFLGLGVPPPTPSWGRMVSEGRSLLIQAPWQSIFPGLFISLAVLGFNLAGDSLRDVWDPRLRIG